MPTAPVAASTPTAAIAVNNATFADTSPRMAARHLHHNLNASATSPSLVLPSPIAADSDGGAIADFSRLDTVSITSSSITDNTAASSGGGIFTEALKLTIDHTTITDNTADGSGGGIEADSNENQVLSITNSKLDGNTAESDGGGIESNAAAATFTSDSFSNNVASDGGGIAFFGTQLTLAKSHVDGNRVESSEGGLEMFTQTPGSSCTITNSTLNNRAGSWRAVPSSNAPR